jgi:hypothetical protein
MAITVRDMARRLKSLNIMNELDTILLELSEVITGLNKEQLSIGLDSNGSKLQDYAQESYAGFKVDVVGSEAPLGTPDLKLTGSFYDGFKIIISGDTVSITSDDIKTLDLEGKYGDTFGLQTDKLTELVAVYILPKLNQRVRQLILG